MLERESNLKKQCDLLVRTLQGVKRDDHAYQNKIAKLADFLNFYLNNIENNEDQINSTSFFLGLSKIIDNILPDNLTSIIREGVDNEIFDIITSVVSLLNGMQGSSSVNNFSISKRRCAKHQDDACTIIDSSRYMLRCLSGRYSSIPNAPRLLIKDAVNFLCHGLDVKNLNCKKIYRIVDDSTREFGNWWSFNNVDNRTEWRDKYAVLKEWNIGTKYIEIDVKIDFFGWCGGAAPQVVPKEKCSLYGGEEQIWVSVDQILDLVNRYPDAIKKGRFPS